MLLLVDGMMEEEEKAATKQLVAAFSNKCYRAYLATCGYVHAHIFLNLVWDFILLVQGLRSGSYQPVRLIPSDRVETSRLVMWGY